MPTSSTRKSKTPTRKELTHVQVVAAMPAGISREDIARRAYEIYEARGKQGGSPLEDWVLAEQQLARTTGPGKES